jgi:hypothetical protein
MEAINPDLLRELARGIDPISFALSLGLTPDQWQRDLLLSSERQIILNCSRQSGKSEITAVLALFHAINHPGALILVLSPSLRQSSELFKKIIGHYHDLGRPGGATIESALTLQLANRSRIVSLPGTEKTIRGYSGVELLLIDEAARVDPELYIAVRPMLAVSGGRLVMLSTPAGMRGIFYETWMQGEPTEWLKIAIKATQCPRISNDFLRQERRTLGERWFSQEYCCEFHENEAALFRMDVIENSIIDFDELTFDLGEGADIDLAPPVLESESELEVENDPGEVEEAKVKRRDPPRDRWNKPPPIDGFTKGD